MASNHLFYKWGRGIDPALPRIERAEDEFLVTAEGDRLIDAAAGAAVVNLGHSPDGLDEVITTQLDLVAYLSLSHFTTDAVEGLADRVAAHTPNGLDHVFPVTSGSEAVETAIKLARDFHRQQGNEAKSVVIGRERSYHGATLGALAAGGHRARRAPYEPLLADWPTIGPAYPYRWSYSGTPQEQARAAAGELEATIRETGPGRVAAFIAEPVGGASIPATCPHPAYYHQIRRICDEYDVLFIADEVMTGFGRTGPLFAVDRFDVVPDILAIGKGLSGGYTPIGAAVVHREIARSYRGDDARFLHGHTFGGNPLSAAIANEVVDRYTPAVLETGRQRGQRIADGLESLADHPNVGELRHVGVMLGIELVRDRESKAPFDPDHQVANRLYEALLDRGVYTYPGAGSVDGEAGDHLMLAPPLTVGEASADRIAEETVEAVRTVMDDPTG